MCFALGASKSTDADKVVKFILDSYSVNLAHNVDYLISADSSCRSY